MRGEHESLFGVTAATAERLRIAVVGSGIAGLSAAWLLSKLHDVTLYEKNARLGGHSNTIDVALGSKTVPVDTGFIVYNTRNYPNLTELFRELGVETEASNMSFAVSLDGGAFEYGGDSLTSLFAQKRNVINPRFLSMLRGILRFYKEAPAALTDLDAKRITLGDYLDQAKFSKVFQDDHLLPMAGAIWSASPKALRGYPASQFVRFFLNHGLLSLTDRPVWRTVKGGSRVYVQKLAQAFRGQIRLGTPVTKIARMAGGITISDSGGGVATYDHVVIGAHADDALALIQAPMVRERQLLGAFTYTPNVAVLHSDVRLMPKRRKVWSSWNYLGARRAPSSSVCVSYWMNRLQNLATEQNIFVTLNPTTEPDKDYRRDVYQHPLITQDALNAQKSFADIQGKDRLWFCGAYLGSGFHEDGLVAGLDVAEALGGVTRPWKTDASSVAKVERQRSMAELA